MIIGSSFIGSICCWFMCTTNTQLIQSTKFESYRSCLFTYLAGSHNHGRCEDMVGRGKYWHKIDSSSAESGSVGRLLRLSDAHEFHILCLFGTSGQTRPLLLGRGIYERSSRQWTKDNDWTTCVAFVYIGVHTGADPAGLTNWPVWT